MLPLLLVPVVVGFGSYGASIASGSYASDIRIAIAVVGLLLLVGFSLRRFLGWVSTHYVVTTHRVEVRIGLLSRTGRDIRCRGSTM